MIGTWGSRIRIMAVFALAMVAAVGGQPAAAQADIENAPDPWVHPGTQTEFPQRVGRLQRTRVTDFSGDQRNASVSYRLDRGTDQLTLTIYVYPPNPAEDCATEFAGVKQAVEMRTKSPPEAEEMRPGLSGDGSLTAYYAAYTMPGNGTNDSWRTDQHTEAYLYCLPGNQWRIKYRATWNKGGTDFSHDVRDLIRAIDWPDGAAG